MAKKRFFLLFLFLLILFTSGCSPRQSQQVAGYIDLENLQPLEPIKQEVTPLRVAVASVVSPQGTVQSYEPLLKYLETKFNRPVELIQRRTYLETNELIADGKVDLAFVCTSAYIEGINNSEMELLVAPQVNGETVYYSLLIVPADSSAQSMADLQHKVFAFTDPISLSGRMYPTYLVQGLGFSPENFFSKTFFTYNHDEAIRAVANKLADGAAVDSLVYEYAIARDPSLAKKVRVIHRSPPFGIPPVVVSLKLDPNLKQELQKVLLSMHDSAEGRIALKSIGVDKFVILDDHAYDDIRVLLSDVEKIK
ncbi:MAG: phosphonate ABC transporter substrate-binding protein [Chloroflexi bacterium 44-23]|nr:MAG: phosphonate ABC transporter substrate-binding protein [Chloroflexi bacterium 44-23]